MDFDSVLDEIGEFGRFQFINYFLVCLPVFFGAANSLSYVFTAAIPNYRCLITDCDSELRYHEDWVQYAVPGKVSKKGTFIPQQCSYYLRNSSVTIPEDGVCYADMFTKEVDRCNMWVFEEGERTIMNDWPDALTCPSSQWKIAFVGTAHFAGIVVGSGLFGVLADKYGRKLILVVCILIMSITGVVNALSTNYEVFTLFTFLNAVGTSGVFPLAFIIGVEMVGRKKRELTGIVLNYFYALGEAVVGIVAWLVPDWVSIQLIVSAPPFLFIVYYWLVPESVRWLIAKKRNRRAEKIIRKAAKMNGATLSDELLSTFEDIDASESDLLKSPAKKRVVHVDTWGMVKQVLRSRVMIVRGLILYYTWATCAFVFYGLSLNSVNLVGNKYMNYILICLVEIPGYSIAWYFMNKIGRRWSLALSLIICGLTCISSAFITEVVPEMAWAAVSLSLIGKMGVTASFGVIYIYSAEMLPTLIRSGGVGSMSTFARVGALVAPFVPLLVFIHESFPMFLFGTVSAVAGLLIFFLPETLGSKLPETVEESINISVNRKNGTVKLDNESGYSEKAASKSS